MSQAEAREVLRGIRRKARDASRASERTSIRMLGESVEELVNVVEAMLPARPLRPEFDTPIQGATLDATYIDEVKPVPDYEALLEAAIRVCRQADQNTVGEVARGVHDPALNAEIGELYKQVLAHGRDV